jgi:hypothetical protein
MSIEDSDRIDKLQAVVAQLGTTLAISESRTTRLERTIRWGALSLALVVALALITVFRPFGFALAQQETGSPSKSAEEAIDRLTESLTGQRSTLGMMGQMMGNMLELGTRRAMAEAQDIPTLTLEDCGPGAQLRAEIKQARVTNQLGFYVKCFFVKTNNANPSPLDYQQAVMSAVTGAAVDLGVLVARVRDDSDAIRSFVVRYVGDSEALLRQIGGELELLNKTLESVPIMTSNVNTMTHQMGIMAANMNSMTHSMGTSMGRMGKWMPW